MSLIFVSGGVRSGKSSFAEKQAKQLIERTSGTLHYIATGVPTDQEMVDRIRRHQVDRAGFGWTTWESPTEVGKLSDHFNGDDIVLLDCLTTWLNNELFQNEIPDAVESQILTEIDRLVESCHSLVIVSNDVFYDAMVDSELVFTYKRVLGRLHQQIVKIASDAFHVESSIPVRMKGGQ